MRNVGRGWLAAFAGLVCAGTTLWSRPAAADTMDPALARFVASESCRTAGPGGTGKYYNPASGFVKCPTYDAYFAKLVAQYGAAVAPTAMHSARTTGYGGFELAIEADYTSIDNDAQYWQLGTEGPLDPTTKKFSIKGDPDSVLQLYSLKIRKGFPFGLELTGNVGFLANTNIITGGADVRMSLLEGFRTGVPGIFPEIAVGGSVRTITGTEEFQLTVAGFDAQISKPIPIGGTIVLTPYVGYQWLRIFGDSGLIDLTPNTDAVSFCDYQGGNTPATPDNSKAWRDGQPVCGSGSSADFNNTVVFDPVRLTRHRIDFGLQMRFQMVKFGAHFVTDLVGVAAANKGKDYEADTWDQNDGDRQFNQFDKDPTKPGDKEVARQWTLAFDLGAVF